MAKGRLSGAEVLGFPTWEELRSTPRTISYVHEGKEYLYSLEMPKLTTDKYMDPGTLVEVYCPLHHRDGTKSRTDLYYYLVEDCKILTGPLRGKYEITFGELIATVPQPDADHSRHIYKLRRVTQSDDVRLQRYLP